MSVKYPNAGRLAPKIKKILDLLIKNHELEEENSELKAKIEKYAQKLAELQQAKAQNSPEIDLVSRFLPQQTLSFEHELANLINKHSLENDSNTPDFILASYIMACLEAFNKTSIQRENWYGKHLSIN